MPLLRAYLFESLRLENGDQRALELGSPLTRSLLAYLLLHRQQPSDRRRLAFIFWSRGTESAARRNLRQYLHRMRQIFEGLDFSDDLILTTGNTVQINPAVDIWLDVDAFRSLTKPDSAIDDLMRGIELYRGDLLSDLYEDWCDSRRHELRRHYLQSLERLSARLQEAYRVEDALAITRQWIAAEPFEEAAHRRLMALYLEAGKRNQALQHYQQFEADLAKGLGVEPVAETQALFEMIQSGNERKNQPVLPRLPKSKSLPQLPLFPLVGRQRELGKIQAAWNQAQMGRGRFLLLTGDSGIGKTRLLHEYLLSTNPQFTLQTLCREVDAMVSYAPLRGVLYEVLARLSEIDLLDLQPWVMALAPILPDLHRQIPNLPIGQLERREKIQTSEAIARILLHLTKGDGGQAKPFLLALDDLHWADSLTWELLDSLTYRLGELPLILLGSCRMEDLSAGQERIFRALNRKYAFSHLPLERLSETESTMLAKYLLEGEQYDMHFFQRLYQETEGNPFFIIEGILSLREGEQPARLPFGDGLERGGVRLPPPIQRLIEARLDRLDAQSQELLGIAAAIGRAFTFSLLEEVSEQASMTVVAALEEWQQKGLVSESADGYDFSHDKIRQVAYANLSRARRQYVHRSIAEIFENAVIPVDAATLAHHYSRSDQAIKALPYLIEAGEQALRIHSYHEAQQFGSQAVSLLGRQAGPRQQQERMDLNLQLAQAYAFSGDLVRAQEMIEQAEQLAAQVQDQARLGRIFRRAAQIFWLRSNPKTASDYAHRALRVAEEQQDVALLRASLRMLGRCSIALAAFDDAIAYLLRYVNLEDANKLQYHPKLLVVYGYLGVAYARVGSWERALEAAERGVALARAEGIPSTVAFSIAPLAYIHAARQNWHACRASLDALPDIQPAVTDEFTPLQFMLTGVSGLVQAHLDDPAKGVEMIREALAWVRKTGYRVFHYLPRIFLAESLLLANDLFTARDEAQNTLKIARAEGNRWVEGVALRLLGEIASRMDKPDWLTVEKKLIESVRILRRIRARPDLARTYLALRRLYDRAGQTAWAVDCHFRATSIYEELGMLEELRLAQGRAAGERKGAVVILDMDLRGPISGEPEQRP